MTTEAASLQYGHRDVSAGATGATAVAPKFSDTLTLSQPGGQILPTIAEVAPKFFPRLRPWATKVKFYGTEDLYLKL